MQAASQRIRQGIRATLAFATQPELSFARRFLSDDEYAAFCSMSRADQLHSLNVLRSVLEIEPPAPPALKAAALLHDVGKARYHLNVLQKTVSVLVKRFAPALSRRLSRDGRLSFWYAPFSVRYHHARWSGEILRKCGADPAVIWLAEQHQQDADDYRDHPHCALLVGLQRADSAN